MNTGLGNFLTRDILGVAPANSVRRDAGAITARRNLLDVRVGRPLEGSAEAAALVPLLLLLVGFAGTCAGGGLTLWLGTPDAELAKVSGSVVASQPVVGPVIDIPLGVVPPS